MATIPIEVSSEQRLRAVERLPTDELAAFAAQVNTLRAIVYTLGAHPPT
jgi:hypothetical protein